MSGGHQPGSCDGLLVGEAVGVVELRHCELRVAPFGADKPLGHLRHLEAMQAAASTASATSAVAGDAAMARPTHGQAL